uniref:Uncharacterized protein n=1 Tax=virus sp. ctML55 TaxID=2827627 RepID=A0A8S5RIC2_9VIRU|nr:MAG TPA: hypothetical protein [virus sp. ctML55]
MVLVRIVYIVVHPPVLVLHLTPNLLEVPDHNCVSQ